MKNIYAFLVLSLLLFSCNSDDNDPEVACLRTSPITNGSFFVELVDAQGASLIGNYVAADITIDVTAGSNMVTITNVVFPDIADIANFISIPIVGEEGDNRYEINLSATETDTLILNLVREEFGDICPVSLLVPISAVYNGEEVEIQDNPDIGYLITVVKE